MPERKSMDHDGWGMRVLEEHRRRPSTSTTSTGSRPTSPRTPSSSGPQGTDPWGIGSRAARRRRGQHSPARVRRASPTSDTGRRHRTSSTATRWPSGTHLRHDDRGRRGRGPRLRTSWTLRDGLVVKKDSFWKIRHDRGEVALPVVGGDSHRSECLVLHGDEPVEGRPPRRRATSAARPFARLVRGSGRFCWSMPRSASRW